MTGIFLCFHPTENVSSSTLQSISRLLKHRGSSNARYLYVDSSYQCRFEDHSIDVDDPLISVVYVPLSDEDNFHRCESDGHWFWAVVDGSIYDLELHGANESAKILVDSYLKGGIGALKSLDGNFSFVLYDGRERLILSGRDKIGTKPLHYFRNRRQLAFSSEIKGFLALDWFEPRINVRNVQRFISHGRDNFYDVKTQGLWETFFKGVFEIPSSHYVKLNLETHQRRLGSYWNPKVATDLVYEEEPDVLARKFLELLRRSVTQSLRDGEKVGVPLSGGIDSTFMAYMLEEAFISRKLDLENLCTISVIFPELGGMLPDESLWINKFLGVSRIQNNVFFSPSSDSFKTEIGKVLWHFEQPLTDDSLFLLWEVARHAAEEGVKTFYCAVSPLTGGFTNVYVAELLLTRPFRGIRKWIGFKRTGKSNLRAIRKWLLIFLLGDLTHRWRERSAIPDGVRRQHEYYFGRTRSGKWTKYFDRSTMAFGIGWKEPFNSNSKLFEFSFHLPDNLKLTEGWDKYIHRRAMSLLENFPRDIIWNPKKMAFRGEMERWVYGDLYDFFLEILSSAKYVDKLVDIPSLINDVRVRELNPYLVWRIVNVELWCRVFFDKQ